MILRRRTSSVGAEPARRDPHGVGSPRTQRDATPIARGRPCLRRRVTAQDGQISLLILGFAVIVMSLVVGGIAVTSAQLSRMELYDVADAAALDAADSIDASAYTTGVADTVPLADASVQRSAAVYVGSLPLPHGIQAWSLEPGTGSPDGRTAVVRMRATADLPLVGGLVRSLGGSVTITVESRARAGVDP